MRKDGKLVAVDWDEALSVAGEKLAAASGDKIAAIAGDLADCESMLALKDLMEGLGAPHLDCRQDGGAIGTIRASYIFNSTIAGIEEADAILLVGTNPRWEAPVLNTRIRKGFLMGDVVIASVGPAVDLTYAYDYLGDDPSAIDAVMAGNGDFGKAFKDAKRPMVIVGSGTLARPDGSAILAKCKKLIDSVDGVSDDWNGFNVLQRAASRVGGLDLGFLPQGDNGLDAAGILAAGNMDVIYLLGADEIDTDKLGNAFVIYQGHHGDAGAHRADVILPGAAYTEKNGTYVNTEGRVQQAALAAFPPGDAKEDWAIIRALSEKAGKTLPYNSLGELRARMVELNPLFGDVDEIVESDWGDFGVSGSVSTEPLTQPIENFFMTDPISRASITMAECTAVANGEDERATGTDG